MTTVSTVDWKENLSTLASAFAERAAAYDNTDAFVAENYSDLRAAKLFSALVPQELGGRGLRYCEVCALIRGLAHSCGSTALAFSMHQHLVGTALWSYRHGKPGETLLRAVAEGEKILVSTGATDWLSSSGVLERCEGGYRFAARKPFASGCLAGDLLVTSGQFNDPVAGRQVLHFSISMSGDGVSIDRVWEAMGMRGRDPVPLSSTVLDPESRSRCDDLAANITPWNVILTVALPIICAVYVGMAEAAAEKALRLRRPKAMTA